MAVQAVPVPISLVDALSHRGCVLREVSGVNDHLGELSEARLQGSNDQ